MKTDLENSSGFTFAEILIAMSIATVIIAGVYSVIYCSNILTAKCLATNFTNVESRNAMDQMQGMLQTAYTVPLTINASGVETGTCAPPLTGSDATIAMAPVYTGTTAAVTGTGVGIKFKRYVGGPYQTVIPTTGLLSTAASGTLTMDRRAVPLPPPPQKYDILAINSTAIISGTGFQVWATVNGAPTSSSTSGNTVTYVVPLSGAMTDKSGTTAIIGTAISYQTDNKNQPITCYTLLLRPTAFLFYTTTATSSTTTELRMLDPYVQNGTIVSATTNVTTITRNVDPASIQASGNLNLPSLFAIVSLDSQTFVSAIMRVGSLDDNNYLANKQANNFSTFMEFSTLIHLKSKP